MLLFIRRLFVSFVLMVIANAAVAAVVDIDIAVLDPDSFALGPPTGDTRWVIEGEGDFLLAEQHGAMASMRFELPAGQYRLTVWELDSTAAAEQVVTLPEGGTAQVALTLSPMNKGLVDEVLARTNEPEPDAGPLPGDAAGSSQASTSVAPLGLDVQPGDVFTITLPGIADAANDLLALSDGRAGWLWSSERGSLDAMAVAAPETPGRYTVEYVQVPEMTVLRKLEVHVR